MLAGGTCLAQTDKVLDYSAAYSLSVPISFGFGDFLGQGTRIPNRRLADREVGTQENTDWPSLFDQLDLVRACNRRVFPDVRQIHWRYQNRDFESSGSIIHFRNSATQIAGKADWNVPVHYCLRHSLCLCLQRSTSESW